MQAHGGIIQGSSPQTHRLGQIYPVSFIQSDTHGQSPADTNLVRETASEAPGQTSTSRVDSGGFLPETHIHLAPRPIHTRLGRFSRSAPPLCRSLAAAWLIPSRSPQLSGALPTATTSSAGTPAL